MTDVQVSHSEDYAKFDKYTQHQYIINGLEKAETEAADPHTQWHTHDEVWGEIWERRKKHA